MTRTEQGIQAFVAALLAQSQIAGAVLPAPMRNNALPARLVATAGDFETYLNVWDGDGDVQDETLGADDAGQADGYNIEHRVSIEWVVARGTDDERRAAFDAGLIAIH